jgi:DNA-binding transcriptional LysR family regulator
MAYAIDWESQICHRLRLRDLNVFFAVVQRGSMAKAAQQLNVTQPAVSRVIADLEHTLGVRLLDRTAQGVSPTMYGRALHKRGTVVFDELKQSIRDIEFLADPTAGKLTIGCAESIAATLIPPIIERFYAKYPRVVLHVDTVPSPAINDPGLRDRKFDLVLGRWPMQRSELADDFAIEVLFDDRLVVAAGAQSRWARRRKIDLAELTDGPWILPPPERWTYACVAEAFRARALAMPSVSLMTFSLPLIIHFLGHGQFITAFPNTVASLHAGRDRLKVLPVDLPAHSWPVAIVTLKNRTLSPVVERFIECAREAAKSIAPGHGRPRYEQREPATSSQKS